MSVTTTEIATQVKTRIENLPTGLDEVGSGTIIQDIIEYAKFNVQAYTGDTISSAGVDEKYAGILADLGEAYARARLANVGVNFNITQGEFTLTRGADAGIHAQRVKDLIEQANRNMKYVGRKVRFKKVYG